MHGTIMLLLYATPIVFGFANYMLPLQIGAPDVAFPRLNAFSYWLYLFGALDRHRRLRHPRRCRRLRLDRLHAADQCAALAGRRRGPVDHRPGRLGSGHHPRRGQHDHHGGLPARSRYDDVPDADLHLEHPGHQHPGAAGVPAARPLRCSGCVVDRHLGGHIFDPATGGAILWQHLFWFFGHPEVYIIALPFFGIVSEIFPVFSRKPIFGYSGLVYATLAIAALSIAVWAHHMYATGAVLLPFFSFMTFLIAVPTGVKFFNWIGTMWKGQIDLRDADAVLRRLPDHLPVRWSDRRHPGEPAARLPRHDTYFVVAHFHYVLFGTIVFATYAGIYFWFPKMTGRMLDERLGKWHFWLTFIGFHITFLVQHWLGNEGMPRRYADYLPSDGFTTLNTISTIGAFVLGASTLPFMWNVFRSYRYGEVVTVDDPWGFGNSLEWATSCPPPRHNFTELPRIRSERPAFELHYPHMVERMRAEAHVGPGSHKQRASNVLEGADRPPVTSQRS